MIGLLVAAVAGVPPAFAGELKIFDIHMHYSSSAWDVYSPVRVLATMDAAGVAWAMASSTPDYGTVKLLDTVPKLIFGEFRPYRTRSDMGRWYALLDLVPYSEKRLAMGATRAGQQGGHGIALKLLGPGPQSGDRPLRWCCNGPSRHARRRPTGRRRQALPAAWARRNCRF